MTKKESLLKAIEDRFRETIRRDGRGVIPISKTNNSYNVSYLIRKVNVKKPNKRGDHYIKCTIWDVVSLEPMKKIQSNKNINWDKFVDVVIRTLEKRSKVVFDIHRKELKMDKMLDIAQIDVQGLVNKYIPKAKITRKDGKMYINLKGNNCYIVCTIKNNKIEYNISFLKEESSRDELEDFLKYYTMLGSK